MKFFEKKRSKIGLALSSGAARGLAHIGALKALKENNVHIDLLAGSSMGALVGACFARKGEIADLEEMVLKIDFKQLFQLADPNLALMLKGFIHGQKVKKLLRAIIGDIEFKDLKIPLVIVATDVNSGEEIRIKEGSVVEAVRASISIPAVFMPVKFKSRFLIDGGIVNPIPVDVAKAMGANFIIASNVIHEPSRRKLIDFSVEKQQSLFLITKTKMGKAAPAALNNKINTLIQENEDKIKNFQKFVDTFKSRAYKKNQKIDPNIPNLFDTVIQAVYIMEFEIARLKGLEADITIFPDTKNIASLEFYRGKEVISKGYKATEKILSKLQKLIKTY
jgi:NTE family protein